MKTCPNCGGTMIGDGYTQVLHCEFADLPYPNDAEPDSAPVLCSQAQARPRPPRLRGALARAALCAALSTKRALALELYWAEQDIVRSLSRRFHINTPLTLVHDEISAQVKRENSWQAQRLREVFAKATSGTRKPK